MGRPRLSSNCVHERGNDGRRAVLSRGLIYKTVRGIVTKNVRTPRSQVLRAPKNIQIYKTLRTYTVRNVCFINHSVPTSVRS